MTPLISLVTGTYERKESLTRMIGSFRNNLPRGIEYEIIVVDAGSKDGTPEWCEETDDVTLIQQGELLGAIAAFDAGAKAANGKYCLLANDDIIFTWDCILPAIVHLESVPTCGAVAFMDDREAPGYEDAGMKVQRITVRVNGQDTMLPYPQVGMIRRVIGDAAGWWGSEDPIMGWGGTYGGDSYLGARIWELGYTVDVVDKAQVHDTVIPDNLRERNYVKEQTNPGAYYKRYPTPPVYPGRPIVPNPDSEQLRILYFPIYEMGYAHQREMKRGLREALQQVGLVYETDYVNNPRYDLLAAVLDWQPHLLLTQCHAPNSIPVEKIAQARAIMPEMTVVNWNGDVYAEHLVSEAMLAYLRHFDLQLVVNASVIPIYNKAGIRAAYWQVAYEPVGDELPDMPRHDVVFLANAYSDERRALGSLLQGMQGVNVGLYGKGWQWGNGDTIYNFAVGASLYTNAKIAIGDNQWHDQKGFVSNRIFEALANGAFLLHQHIPGLEDLTGIKSGVHYIEWSDVDDLQKQVRYWLNPRKDAERKAIAADGQRYVRGHHSFDCRVQELFGLLEGVK